MPEPILLEHPLARHHLAELRDAATPPERFRAAVRRLGALLACEATRDLTTRDVTVQTPVAAAPAAVIADRIGIIPILRAGLGMVDPLLDLLPEAEVWHLGVYRDEQTLQPVQYYHKLPRTDPPDLGIVIDPMLATGGSSVWALRQLRMWGVRRVKLLSLIAAPEGVGCVRESDPDVQIYIAAMDQRLNEHGFIVPGLGDAGDRMFNTLPRA